MNAMDRIRYYLEDNLAALTLLVGVALGAGLVFALTSVFSDDGDEYVVINDDLTVSVTNRNDLPFGVSFELPQSCGDVRAELELVTVGVADDQIVSKVVLLSALGEELCSFADWTTIQRDVISPWTAPAEN